MMTLLRRLGRRGASAAEFAIWAPLLLLLLLGGFDVGNQVQVSMRLEHAARAGAQVAFAAPGDPAAIRQAVLLAWPALTALEVTVACLCGVTAQTCGTSCIATEPRTIRISAIRTLSPLLLPTANRSEGHATIRLG
jgi:hypothetical protein